ncbi:unnamed protein product [Paramecium pentaurelia]|uniref:Uncharacterized protein n=1 Tax=Paramecium pentaurelia TaxID=43138 RepID=A0A8S1UGF4_9CILI|nr:unnamed protein product [Paramecium pentaurelia]
MGAACKKDEIEIKNLYSLYLRVSKQKLPDQLAIELHSIRTKLIKDKIPKQCQLIYNILLNNIKEEAIQQAQRIKFQQVQKLDHSNIQNDKLDQLFCISFRFLNFEELRKYIEIDDFNNNSNNCQIINLFNATDIYCKKVRLFLSRISPKYYMYFYSLLWKQYKQNVDVLSNIFSFDFINNDKFQKIPFNFTFQQFMYKIWGNNIQPYINKIQIRDLLYNKKNDELNQYFDDFIEISINEHQLEYSGNIGLTHSKGFKIFLNQLLELLYEEFDIGCNKNLEDIIQYVKNNRFLNQQLNEQILIHYIYPQIFEYIESQLSMMLKEQFKVTKQYLKEQIIQDKVSNNTLSKLLLEEDDENYTKTSNILSSQCKTNYTSSLKANYLSIQNQDETTFFNYENNKWEYFTNVQHSSYLNIVEQSNKVEEVKQRIDERSNKLFKKFRLETVKQQDFAVQYINIMFDYTHINKKEEISDLIFQLNLFY